MLLKQNAAEATMESLFDSHTPDARARDAHELRQTTLGKMARVTEPPLAAHSTDSFNGSERVSEGNFASYCFSRTLEELRYDLEIFILAP